MNPKDNLPQTYGRPERPERYVVSRLPVPGSSGHWSGEYVVIDRLRNAVVERYDEFSPGLAHKRARTLNAQARLMEEEEA